MISKALTEHVASRGDLVSFIRMLAEGLKREPVLWENTDLKRFLEAMAAWIEDVDGFFLNSGERVPENPTWKLVAQILAAAAAYE